MKNNQTTTTESPNEILDELQALVTKAEKLISSSVKSRPSEIASALQERFSDSQGQLNEFYTNAKGQIVAGAKTTHNAIRANPYQSLAIATGVGVLLGAIVGRRSCARE